MKLASHHLIICNDNVVIAQLFVMVWNVVVTQIVYVFQSIKKKVM